MIMISPNADALADFGRGEIHLVVHLRLREPCAPVLVPADAYVVAHGFHDDDRTIDDKPEVYRTELIRFPLTPKSFIIPKANNMDNGITVATTSPAR